MTREELAALGLTDEQVNGVMTNYGKSIKQLQDGLTAAQGASETAKTELNKYLKGGEKYVDSAEIERLKKFETDTLGAAEKAKKTDALAKLYKGANANESIVKLLISGQNLDNIELSESGELKNGGELLKKAKADYADLFAAVGDSGVPQAKPDANGGGANKPTPKVF